MSYTKGPWSDKCIGSEGWRIYPADGDIRDKTKPIAQVDFREWEVDKANARLIASAPNMLEAIHELILHCPRGWSLELDQALTAAREAIQQAEGEESRQEAI